MLFETLSFIKNGTDEDFISPIGIKWLNDTGYDDFYRFCYKFVSKLLLSLKSAQNADW